MCIYFWSLSQKQRNQLIHSLNGNGDSDSEEDLDFPAGVDVFEERLVAVVINQIRDNAEEEDHAEERVQLLRDNLESMDADSDAEMPDVGESDDDPGDPEESDYEWITDKEGEDLPDWQPCDHFCQNKKCPLGVTVDSDGNFLHGGHEFYCEPPEEFVTGSIVDFTWNTFTPFKPTITETDFSNVVDMIADDAYFDKVQPIYDARSEDATLFVQIKK